MFKVRLRLHLASLLGKRWSCSELIRLILLLPLLGAVSLGGRLGEKCTLRLALSTFSASSTRVQASFQAMIVLHSTRLAPRLALRAPFLATSSLAPHLRGFASSSSSLKVASPSAAGAAHTQRSFSTFPALRNPQPEPPVKAESKDAPSGFQPHFQDGPTEMDAGQLETPFVSSRPHEDYVWHPVYKPEGEFGLFDLRRTTPPMLTSTLELNAVKVVRLERKTITDKLAFGMVKFARWGFDFVRRCPVDLGALSCSR